MDRQRETDRMTDRQTDRQKAMLTRHYSYGKYIHQKYLAYLTSKYNHTIRKYCLRYLFQLFVKTSLYKLYIIIIYTW